MGIRVGNCLRWARAVFRPLCLALAEWGKIDCCVVVFDDDKRRTCRRCLKLDAQSKSTLEGKVSALVC